MIYSTPYVNQAWAVRDVCAKTGTHLLLIFDEYGPWNHRLSRLSAYFIPNEVCLKRTVVRSMDCCTVVSHFGSCGHLDDTYCVRIWFDSIHNHIILFSMRSSPPYFEMDIMSPTRVHAHARAQIRLICVRAIEAVPGRRYDLTAPILSFALCLLVSQGEQIRPNRIHFSKLSLAKKLSCYNNN